VLAFDRRHLWHPYASIPPSSPPLLVRSAAGVRLAVTTPEGEELEVIDAMSSWWAAIHGYAHPALVAAASSQAAELSHVMFGGLTHRAAVELGERLLAMTPEPLERIFYADSGSVAVEVAAKMALQYWRSAGRPEKRRLFTWRRGYHGDTLFAMSVCDPDGGMHAMWTDVVPEQVFVPEPPGGFDTPPDPAYVHVLDEAIARHAHELAAVVVEPVVQGAGGMRFHSPTYLSELRASCDRHGVLLVFDEIASGFFRTGRAFAADWAGVAPDVMCVGKALTGGMLGLAATLCTAEVADIIGRGEVPVLAHGPTFMANPLACAVASASLDLLRHGDPAADVARLEAVLRSGLAPAADVVGVVDVRVLGGIGVIQLDHDVDIAAATGAALAHGVWVRPFRDLVYAMPPYITDDADLVTVTTALVAAAAAG